VEQLATHARDRRRRLLLDPQWQISRFRTLAFVALGVCAVQAVANHLVSSLDVLDRWSGEQVALLALGTNALFVGLLGAGLWFATLRITHSIVGPARVLQRAIEALAQDRFDGRVELRQSDYLTDLAAATSSLAKSLEARRETASAFARELESALDAADLPRARELVAQWSRLHGADGGPTLASDRKAA
jgi:hypothetical protein